MTIVAPERTVDPHPCECGCGEVTNLKQIAAWELRNAGERNVDIAKQWGMSPAGIKALLAKGPARFVNAGHRILASSDGWITWTCERCGNDGRIGKARIDKGEPMPRYCQRTECMASEDRASGSMRRAINQNVQAGKDAKKIELEAWFAKREHLLQMRVMRQKRRTPEMRMKMALAEGQYRKEQQDRGQEWMDALDPEIQADLRKNGWDVAKWEVRLDGPFSKGFDNAGATLGDMLPYGYNPRDDAVEWHDPVGETVVKIIEDFNCIEDFLRTAQRASIVPDELLARYANGEFAMIEDDDGVRFVFQRTADGGERRGYRSHVASNGVPKIPYDSKKSAEESIAKRGGDSYLLPYLCRECAEWHVGKPPKWMSKSGPEGLIPTAHIGGNASQQTMKHLGHEQGHKGHAKGVRFGGGRNGGRKTRDRA